jgi:hypothetical protein
MPLIHDIFKKPIPGNRVDRVKNVVGHQLWDELVTAYQQDFEERRIEEGSLNWMNTSEMAMYLAAKDQERLLFRPESEGESNIDEGLFHRLLEVLAGKSIIDPAQYF